MVFDVTIGVTVAAGSVDAGNLVFVLASSDPSDILFGDSFLISLLSPSFVLPWLLLLLLVRRILLLSDRPLSVGNSLQRDSSTAETFGIASSAYFAAEGS